MKKLIFVLLTLLFFAVFSYSSKSEQDLKSKIMGVPPGPFNNLSPANGATNQPVNGLVLDWEDSSGADAYDLYFGTSSPPTLFQSDILTSTYTLNGLSANTQYFWYVVAKNAFGTTQGAEWNFTTSASSRVFTLTSANPTCGNPVTVGVNIDNADGLIAVQWSKVGQGGLVFDNTVFSYSSFALGPAFATWLPSVNAQPDYINFAAIGLEIPAGTGAQTIATFTFNTLSTVCDGTQPWFRLRNVQWSTLTQGDQPGNDYDLQLTVSCPANPPISTPANPNPSDGATNVPIVVTLNWDDSTGANAYDLYFGTTNPPPFFGTTLTSSYGVSLASNTQYYWYVDAYNTGNACPHNIGPVWSFTTCALPGAFNNLSPSDGATGQPINGLVLDWEDSLGATSYDLYFGTTSPPPLFQSDLATSTYTLNGLSNGQTYYWYVVARNACGSTAGEEWDFTTMPLAGVNLEYMSSNFTDFCTWGGIGNGNGAIDPGEDISLYITLSNTGTDPATGVSATITTTTPGITITNNNSTYPNIPASGTGQSNSAYTFSVDHLIACGTIIDFTINITSNEGGWTDTFQLQVGGNVVTILSENFDSVVPPALPANWESIVVNNPGGTDPAWATNAGTHHPSGQPAHSAPNLVWFNSYHTSSGSTARLQYNTPFNFSSFGTITMSFWMYHDTGYSGSNDRVQVQYSTNGATWNNIGPEISRYDGTTGWAEHTVDLTSLSGQANVWIAILGISAYGNDIHLDDITITGTSAAPVCFECWCYTPESFNLLTPADGAINQPINNLLLDWENSNHATAYDLYFGTSPSPPLYQSNILLSEYTVSGLSLNTTYYWYVVAKSACGTYTSSEWSFTTTNCVQIAYGFDLNNANLVSFDLATPGTFTIIGSIGADDPFGGDFLGNDYTKIYALLYNTNQLVTYSTTDASKTIIGSSIADPSAPYWVGMAEYNGTLYAISTNCSGTTYLYTIDPTNGAVTTIGQVPGVTCAINLGATPTGLLYTLDIADDNIYRIDRTTASATLVGPVGFNASYAQGMEFDIDGATMYLAAYNAGTWQGELRSLDLSTGASALIGPFQGGTEVDGMAITSCKACSVFPSSFNLLLPTNGATGEPVANVQLDWEDSADTLVYNLYFGTTNPPPLYATSISTSDYLITGPLSPNTTYYWYVEAVGACGITQSNSTFSFTTVIVVPPPAIFYDSSSLQEDICPTGGAGHHNYSIDPGETIYLNVFISNEATAGPLTGITGTLSTSTPGVTILTDTATFPDLLPGNTVQSNTPFIFEVADTFVCGSNIQFSLTINGTDGNGNPYQTTLNFSVGVGSTDVLMLDEWFNSGVFPPNGWATFDLDGGGTYWDWIDIGGGLGAAYHDYYTPSYQDGWLVTPPLSIPATATSATLSFWEYTAYAAWYGYHGLWVCTSGCGTPPTNWVEIQEIGSPVEAWRQQFVDLTFYAGQTIYLAFVYQGQDADLWAITGVQLEVTTSDPFCVNCTPGVPALSYASHTITDDCLAGGAGDRDGIADPGEYVDIYITIQNTGTANTTGVSGIITTATPDITIINGAANYPNILAGGSGTSLTAYRIYIAETVACGTVISFDLQINSDQGSWTDTFNLNVGTAPNAILINEGFESTTFPPSGWARYDLDGGGEQWVRADWWSYTGGASAVHPYDWASDQDGWLVTPQITIPATATTATLSFWEYTDYAAWYVYHGLWVCTSGCGTPPTNWAEIQEIGSPVEAWRQQTIDLTAYAGQAIQLAFVYQGLDADDWYIDDVVVSYGGAVPQCNVCICPAPAPFNLLTPPDASIDVPLTNVTLDWEDSLGATSYNLYFGTTSPPPIYQLGLTTSQYTIPTLNPNTTYFWNVDAVNVCGTTITTIWSFTTCSLPGSFNLVSPTNGATNLPTTVLLDWQDSSNATSYNLYFGTNPTPPLYQTNITQSQYTVSGLSNSATYYWRVEAVNTCGVTSSATWHFTTETGCIPPDTPQLIAPENGSTDLVPPVTLEWYGSNADYFEVYLGTAPNQMNRIGTTTGFTFTVSNLEQGTTYYWAINAVNSCGSAFSSIWSFKTQGEAPEEEYGMIVPAVASAEGARSSYWKTDVQIFNPNNEVLDYTISFVPPETDGTATPYKVTGTINPYELKIFNDVVKSTFGLDQIAGGLFVESKKYLIATARTYTTEGEGTYGQFVKGYLVNDAIGADGGKYLTRQDEVAHIPHLTNAIKFRTNVGFMEVLGKNVTAHITLFDGQNNNLGEGSFDLLPMGFLQVNNIFNALNITEYYSTVRAEIKVYGDGAIFSYASIVDNQSNDAIFVPAVKETGNMENQSIAVAVHKQGDKGTYWRSELRLFNLSENPQEVTFTFIEKGEVFEKKIEIEGRNVIRFNDAIQEIFELQDNYGYLNIKGSSPLISTSRIYTTKEEFLTYGQFVPTSLIQKSMTQKQSQYILHMTSNELFRTNLGFTEISGQAVTIEVALYNKNGTEIGKGTFNLSPYEQKQINRIFEIFNAGQVDNGYAKITVLSGGGSVLTYASVVDNITGDAIYVIGQ